MTRWVIRPSHVSVSSLCIATCIAFSGLGLSVYAADSASEKLYQAIARTDGSTQQDQAASNAVSTLHSQSSEHVTDVLDAFDNASERGANWLRALAADVSDNGPFQTELLQDFFNDRSKDSRARYVAFQLLTQNDPASKTALLSKAESDPSLPIRYLKIKTLIDQAKSVADSDAEKSKSILQQVVSFARSPSQLSEAEKLLDQQGVKVDLAKRLAMVVDWSLIGPFDNTDSQHFDTAYTVENRYRELGQPYENIRSVELGKNDVEIQWQPVSSDDKFGMVDLNPPLKNEKDGTAYVFAKFSLANPDDAGSAQARLGCITANKVWVNGKLALSNEVYHSGTRIDQYVGDCELVAGENTVMIKVLQNAQTQPWAQDWQFQFRFTRPDGSALPVVVKK